MDRRRANLPVEPGERQPHAYGVRTPELVDQACQAAEEAFWTYGDTTRAERADFLGAIADEIEARPEPIPFFGELGSVNPMFVLPDEPVPEFT